SGQEPRPWLGVYATEVSNHVVIMGVASRGPASDFDLRQGDIVLNVSGKDVNSLGGFYRRIWELGPAGVEVPLQILRDNQPHEITIKSGDRAAFLKSPALQ
ncbi:MAG: S1C family serine protease, partial [Anaerolineae bacterium]|nr:S1C family serine protease [Anaerolineae bacterium]